MAGLRYRTTNDNDIQFVASDTRGRAFFRNVGMTRRQGMEATIGYRVSGLKLRAGYAFTDATLRTQLLFNAPDNPQANGDGRILVRAGDRLPGVPRHRALVSLNYDTERWSLGADVQAASGQHLFGDRPISTANESLRYRQLSLGPTCGPSGCSAKCAPVR